jgi:hypothetical protein
MNSPYRGARALWGFDRLVKYFRAGGKRPGSAARFREGGGRRSRCGARRGQRRLGVFESSEPRLLLNGLALADWGLPDSPEPAVHPDQPRLAPWYPDYPDAYELDISPLATHSFFHTEGRDIVADNPGEKMTFRGVNLTGLEYGSFFDYPYTGDEGSDYSKPWASELVNIADAGLNLVRLPFEWARLVPGWSAGDPLPNALDADYLAMLDDVVNTAAGQGLYVVLDMHDFLKYWSGQSAQVGVNASVPHQQLLARTWQLLAAHYADEPAVLGYDLMNEPVRDYPFSTNWHTIAQDVVDAIRAVDVNHLIFVEGPNYSLASHWPVDNPAPFITDTLSPAKIVYSPHVYFDYGNDSQYDDPGEDVGPMEGWEYYVRDRLVAALDWSIDYDVPLFFGEMGVPCTTEWAAMLDHTFDQFFDPLEVSTAAWQYIDTARWPYPPAPELNLAECGTLMDVLADHPGGVYEQSGDLVALPPDSLIYDDARVNPWHEGAGYWGAVTVDLASTGQIHAGSHAISVEFGGNYGGLKFSHSYGIDTTRFSHLSFWIYPTSEDLDFRLFTNGPLPDNTVFPASYEDRPSLSDYVPGGLVPGQWQHVEIPLADFVDPSEPVITGIAFQDDGEADPVFYLDQVRLELLSARDDLIVDFGQPGLWVWQNDAQWWKLHGVSPENVVAADLDGNGQSDAVVDFGPAGVWVWENNSQWVKLHASDPEDLWTADLDGNGQADVIIDFGPAGLWVRENNAEWFKLHGVSPEGAAAGDFDGDGDDEAAIDFGPAGLWGWDRNTLWTRLHTANADGLAAADLDGNGQDELIVDFGWRGLWVWRNNTLWQKLYGKDPDWAVAGDLDGNGQDDLAIDFADAGLWVWKNDTEWQKLHGTSPENAVTGDLDGTGQDELIVDFGPPGLWGWYNHATWRKLHGVNPEGLAAGNLDGLSPSGPPAGPAVAGVLPLGAAAAHDAALVELGAERETPAGDSFYLPEMWWVDARGRPGADALVSRTDTRATAAVQILLATL